jgi:DNA-binding NarL/FixJ family response regulator
MTDLPFRVKVLHCEPITAFGLRALLVLQPGVDVVQPGSHEADVIVTDYDDALRRLTCDRDRQQHRRAPSCVVIVTPRVREHEIRRAIAQGALGFVCQDCDPEELVEAVRSAARRTRYLSRAVSASMADGLAHARADLTDREMQVLELVASGLCNKLIGSTLEIAPTTAKSHVRAILDKLGARSRTEAAAIAARRGLVPGFQEVVMRRRDFPGLLRVAHSTRHPEQAALQ